MWRGFSHTCASRPGSRCGPSGTCVKVRNQGRREHGRRQATRLLLAKVAGEAGGMHLILDTELVVRAST